MNPKSYETSICNSIYLESEISDLFLLCNDNEHFHEDKSYQATQEISDEYRHADRKRHCDMWFMFRGLREKFDDIGRSQLKKPHS